MDDNETRISGARRADVTGVGAWEPSCRGFGIAKILKKLQLHPRQGRHPVDVGFDGLAVMVQEVLMQDPHSGALFAFKGKRGDLIKLLWWDGQGLCLFAKRLEKGRFIWPMAATGTVSLSAAQLAMLLGGTILWKSIR
ncbi:MAG: hypothetical protein CR217_19305 [Beijerinckiaceae bacterium]|nr:MAG: hypothetical protein CR217_19305 [Beijerinckiaceae bacterium]